ncbi:hypothetical protein DSUL_50312 [Desulfovibrionales bacterium]
MARHCSKIFIFFIDVAVVSRQDVFMYDVLFHKALSCWS